jgi:quercetin dioxygenase-like cupin family protein
LSFFLGQNDGRVVYVPPGEGPSRWAFGDKYTVKSGEHNTGKSLYMIEALVPPGGGPPPHIHHWEEESFYVLEGTVEVRDNDEKMELTAGAFVYVPRGTVHSFKNIGDDPCKLLIMFTPGGKDRFFLGYPNSADNGAPPPPMTEHDKDFERCLRIGAEFGDEYLV